MIYKAHGIVLHTLKFGETSIIARIYTDSHGLISCMVHGVRKSKTQNKAALFQLMNQVEVVFYSKSKEQLSTLKEIKLLKPYHSIHSDIRKSTVTMFLSEVILKAMKEEETNPPFFDFLSESLFKLDLSEINLPNFHLFFLFKMTSFLGIQPQNNYSGSNVFFDLENGIYKAIPPNHTYFLNEETSKVFSEISRFLDSDIQQFEISKKLRKSVLVGLIEYYKLHLSGFGDVRSLEILEEVFG